MADLISNKCCVFRSRLITISITLIILLSTGLLFIGKYIFEQATYVKTGCSGQTTNTPEKFYAFYDNEKTDYDLSSLWFKDYEKVTIDSNQPNVKLSGWAKQGMKNSPWIILVHGVSSCKRSHTVLTPAAMLVKSGFSVLLIDLREHGESTKITHRHKAGQEEWHDVISAWEWVHNKKGVPKNKIGLYGTSFGAGIVALTFSKQPEIQTVWLDTPFSDMQRLIRSELIYAGFPGWFEHVGRLAGKIFYNIDITGESPLKGADKVGDRNIFIAYSDHDERIPKIHGDLMCQHAKSSATSKGSVTCWSSPYTIYLPKTKKTVGHTVAMVTHQSEWNSKLVAYFSNTLGTP